MASPVLLDVFMFTVLLLMSPVTVRGLKGITSVPLNQNEPAVKNTGSVLRLSGSSAYQPCGDGLCVCSKYVANCSGHTNGLSYIPGLPSSIRQLYFTYNGLTEIAHVDFFENATYIAALSLAHNNLTKIAAGAFRRLKWLKYLDISYNHGLNYTAISRVLNVASLRKLYVKGCKLGPVPDGYFHNATLPNLVFFFLDDNHQMKKANLSNFMPLKGLIRLSLAGNEIWSFHVDVMNNLIKLNMSYNGLYTFPKTCGLGNISYFPRLTHLFLKTNSISAIGRVVCLPQLRVLDLSGNNFSSLPSDTFGVSIFPKLEMLYLEMMHCNIKSIASHAFNNSSLYRITFAFDRIRIDHALNPDTFANCAELNDLRLCDNDFTYTDEQRFFKLFGRLIKMRILNLDNCQISHVTSAMFANCIHLWKLLLNRNYLSVIPDGMFDGLAHLTYLNLDSNKITAISSNTFDTTTRQRLTFLDLSGNPFTCDCDILWFHAWMVSDPSIFSKSWTTYACQNLVNTTVQQFSLNEQTCLLSRTANLLIIVVLSLIILSLTTSSIVCRYRWHIRLLIYEVFRRRGEAWRRRLRNAHYDVFVSYDSDDLPWVRRHLMPELKERQGLRLCLHQRDFVPGNDIVDNIMRCVDASKKVMMLFSANFVRSNWCQFELSLCLQHVTDIEDTLVIVRLDDIPSRDLTGAMMTMLKTTTFIQWEDQPDAIMAFWGRLHIALRDIHGND